MDDKQSTTSISSRSLQPSDAPPLAPGPRNTSSETQVLTADVITWFHRDHGSDCRVIRELVLGERRIDLLFVYAADIVGVEIKGPKDSLGDGRMLKQMREYSFWIPEVWLAVDARWEDHESVKHFQYGGNLLVSEDGVVAPRGYTPKKPVRDEMCCSRLLDLLWNEEIRHIATRHRLLSQTQRVSSKEATRMKGMIARMLTGHEIMKETCLELRSRPLTGIASDAPLAKPSRVSSHQPSLGLFSRDQPVR